MSPWKSENSAGTLDNLRPGIIAAVLEVLERGRHDRKLQEMGFVPGASVEVLSQGQPMIVRLGEQRLCLRQEAAEAVSVFPA